IEAHEVADDAVHGNDIDAGRYDAERVVVPAAEAGAVTAYYTFDDVEVWFDHLGQVHQPARQAFLPALVHGGGHPFLSPPVGDLPLRRQLFERLGAVMAVEDDVQPHQVLHA